MKKTIISIIVVTMILSLTACGDSEPAVESSAESSVGNNPQTVLTSENESQTTTEDTDIAENVTIDTSWYSDDSSAICDGVYVVGKDIMEENYIFTCTNAPYSVQITVFENQEKYELYHKSGRFTNGEEDDAISANAFSNEYIYEDEQYALNLKDGNILMIEGGRGTMLAASGVANESTGEVTGDKMTVVTGIYQTGDIKSDTYMLTCLQSDYDLKVVLFANKESYDNYMSAERFTNGEETAAVEQNAWSDFYIKQGESCYLNVTDGNVLMLDNGVGQIESVSMNWANIVEPMTESTVVAEGESGIESTIEPSKEPLTEEYTDIQITDENLTIENNEDLVALFSDGENTDLCIEFVDKYKGKAIEFDGYIAYMSNHDEYTTRYDILIYAGDYSEDSSNLSPAMQFRDVNTNFDLNLVGDIPDYIGVGDNLHIVAEVDELINEYLIVIEPISVTVR